MNEIENKHESEIYIKRPNTFQYGNNQNQIKQLNDQEILSNIQDQGQNKQNYEENNNDSEN